MGHFHFMKQYIDAGDTQMHPGLETYKIGAKKMMLYLKSVLEKAIAKFDHPTLSIACDHDFYIIMIAMSYFDAKSTEVAEKCPGFFEGVVVWKEKESGKCYARYRDNVIEFDTETLV